MMHSIMVNGIGLAEGAVALIGGGYIGRWMRAGQKADYRHRKCLQNIQKMEAELGIEK
jgi:hypothetical protein